MTTSPTIAPAITKGSTVLVTGATGFIGSWTALEFVKQGYRVRAPVRNRAKGRILKEVLEQEYGPNKVEIVIITDMTDPQVYDEAIKGQCVNVMDQHELTKRRCLCGCTCRYRCVAFSRS